MFERYTEKARRVIFFARYEASQLGSPYIENEHLLLGLLREDKSLLEKLLHGLDRLAALSAELRASLTPGEQISTSVDLPLSHAAKRTLAYGAEESNRLSDRHIGTDHLLLGLLREPQPPLDEIFQRYGLRLDDLRANVSATRIEHRPPAAGSAPALSTLQSQFYELTTRLTHEVEPALTYVLSGRE